MDKKLTQILAGLLFGVVAVSEANVGETSGLNAREKAMVPISAFTASGNMDKLKAALNDGLDAGITVNEIKEILVHLYAYAGFPRSLNGINTFMDVLKDRELLGLKDEPGKEASPMPADKTSIELGTEVQTQLVGHPVTGEIFTFAPAIDQFLKAHLFGDIFGRDVLDFKTREIVTISALANMEGLNPQLQSHFKAAMNIGLTEAQLKSLIAVIDNKVGRKQAENASDLLEKVSDEQYGVTSE